MRKLSIMILLLALFSIPHCSGQVADGSVALRGAIGPSFTFMASFELDETAFANLG